MKTLFLTITLIVGLNTYAEAQQMQRAGVGSYAGIQQIIVQHGDDLQLTDSQKRELAALSLEYRQNRQRNIGIARSDRGSMRGNREVRQRDGSRRSEARIMQGRDQFENRAEIQQKIRETLSEDQVQTLQGIMTERAENAHDFRVLRHGVMAEKAGISGDKAEQVVNLMNRQSENRLSMEKSNIENPSGADREAFLNHFQSMQEMRDELKQILTVAEYERLQSYMGMQRPQNRQVERRVIIRNR